MVLENIVGLLSSNGGQDFGIVLQAPAQRGYMGCWRVLDAQYFGLAQT
jgi:DNA (cytosine-5)-methyltransferase 1